MLQDQRATSLSNSKESDNTQNVEARSIHLHFHLRRNPFRLWVEAGLWHFQISQLTNCDLENSKAHGIWCKQHQNRKKMSDVNKFTSQMDGQMFNKHSPKLSCHQSHQVFGAGWDKPFQRRCPMTPAFARTSKHVSFVEGKQIAIPMSCWHDLNTDSCAFHQHNLQTQSISRNMQIQNTWITGKFGVDKLTDRWPMTQPVQAKHLGQVSTDCSPRPANMNSTCANENHKFEIGMATNEQHR